MSTATTRTGDAAARALLSRDMARVEGVLERTGHDLEAAKGKFSLPAETESYVKNAVSILKDSIAEVSRIPEEISGQDGWKPVVEMIAQFTKKYTNWVKQAFPEEAASGMAVRADAALGKLDSSDGFSRFERRMARYVLATNLLDSKIEDYGVELIRYNAGKGLSRRTDGPNDSNSPHQPGQMVAADDKIPGTPYIGSTTETDMVLEPILDQLLRRWEMQLRAIVGELARAEAQYPPSVSMSEYVRAARPIVESDRLDKIMSIPEYDAHADAIDAWFERVYKKFNQWYDKTFESEIKTGTEPNGRTVGVKLFTSQDFTQLEKLAMQFNSELRYIADRKKLIESNGESYDPDE